MNTPKVKGVATGSKTIFRLCLLLLLSTLLILCLFLWNSPHIITTLYSAQIPTSTTFDHWRVIIPDLFVYSAHWVWYKGSAPEIQLIIIGKLHSAHGSTAVCKCDIFDAHSNLQFTTTGIVEQLPEHHDATFASGKIHCKMDRLHRFSFWVLTRIHLVCENGTSHGTVEFPLPELIEKSPAKMAFVHCASPLWGKYDQPMDVIDFVEYYRSLGVSKFIFYMTSVSLSVTKVLSIYQHQGLVEVLNWTLPVAANEIYYFGQMAALNDCFLRTSSIWDYVINADPDEFIATSRKGDLPEVVHSGEVDCVVIRTSVVTLPSSKKRADYCLSSEADLFPVDHIWPDMMRSKYICRGRNVVTAGIHSPHAMVKGTRILKPAPEESVMLHFRNPLSGAIETALNTSQSAELSRFWVKTYCDMFAHLKNMK